MKTIKFKGIDEVCYYEKLPNGLEIYMYPKDAAKNFYLTFNVRFGSMDTEFKNGKMKKYTKVPAGTAHFLEHQMFNEGEGHSAFEYFAKLGSSINAFTTYNYTCYEVVSSSNFKENLTTLIDYVQNPVFTTQSVNKERGIIKEEIKMYDNTPGAVLHFGLEANVNKYDHHKYLISGTVDDIKEVTPDTLMECYDTFYKPSNMFMVLTGKFSPLEALGIIKENQAGKTFQPKERVNKKRIKEPVEVDCAYEEKEMDVNIPKLKIGYKLDKTKFKPISDTLLKIYLSAILDIKFGPTSDFFERILEEGLSNFDVVAEREVREDYVYLSFEVETEYKEEVIDLIREELKSIIIAEDELERIKRVMIANFILRFNDIIGIAEDIEDDVLSTGKIEADIMDIYKSLNAEEANRIASLINTENESIFYINRIQK